VVTERDIDLGGGRKLHTYDTGTGDLALLWHHGTPNIGAPPVPLFETADRLGIRWVSYDRPSYGSSTPQPGRTVGDAAGYAEAVADALGIQRFAVMGHSGGSSHALATAAGLGDRVLAVASISAVAPYGVEGLDWFGGMAPSSEGSLRAAAQGRAAKQRYENEDTDLPPGFTAKDEVMFAGEWGWLLDVVRPALARGNDGLVDDDLAYVTPWGRDPAAIGCRVLLMHGADDIMVPSSHSAWLATRIKDADLRQYDGDGHISVLTHAADAVRWLAFVDHGRAGP
jgi:pimeloyl-ACP methyl ester carboxylesterase